MFPVLKKLKRVKQIGPGQWMAECPAHKDGEPSLKISGTRGRALLHCFAGCGFEAVCQAGKIEKADLYLTPPEPRKTILRTYDYRDENGVLLFQVVRLAPKDFFQRRPQEGGGWIRKLGNVRRVLYRLPELITADPSHITFVTEGEDDANAVRELGLTATTNPCGVAGGWRKSYSESLRGRDVVILPDNDEPGQTHADKVANALAGIARRVRILKLPNVPLKGDVSDWLRNGGTAEQLLDLAIAAPDASPTESTVSLPQGDRAGKVSVATQIVDLTQGLELFRHSSRDDDLYVTVPIGDHSETWLTRSTRFRHYLQNLYFSAYGKVASSSALQDAASMLTSKAIFSDASQEIWLRTAKSKSGFYIDLVNADWQAVRVNAAGWEVKSQRSPKFRRAPGMQALPFPAKGGNVEELRSFINIRDDADWMLLVGWLIAALCPVGPYPILIIEGEQGCAKSTLCRMLRRLVDPNQSPLRSAPHSERDLLISANNSWVLLFDNLSFVQPWLSDALCRLATGGGFATRRLYANDEETIFSACRPIILNGISGVASRPDLLDRSIILTLPVIEDTQRVTEDELFRQFDLSAPRILAGLLDALSAVVRHADDIHIESPPRMADFARKIVAVEETLGWGHCSFLDAYESNRRDLVHEGIEASVVGPPLLKLLHSQKGQWSGTFTDLLALLKELCPEEGKQRSWPKNARALSSAVNRIAPSLRRLGYCIDRSRFGHNRDRILDIIKSPAGPSASPATSEVSGNEIASNKLEKG